MKRFYISALLFCISVLFAGDDVLRWHASLNGVWQGAFCDEPDCSEVSWGPVVVPSFWTANGNHDQWSLPEEARNAKHAFFKLNFDAPAEWTGRRIFVEFEFIAEGWSVSVNGMQVAESGTRAFNARVELTPAVKFGGSNELIVRTSVENASQADYAGVDWKYRWDVGLSRDVWLDVVPEEHIRYTLITPSVRRHTLGLKSKVACETADGVALRATVLDGATPVLEFPEQSVGQDGFVTAEVDWENPDLWGFGEYGSAKMYSMRLELVRDGKVIDVAYERFGFREFYTEGDRFMFNGKPFFIQGDLITSTHENLTHKDSMIAYLQWMRDRNFNFFRLHSSCYWDNPTIMDAADETGFLIQPEMMGTRVDGKKVLADDPVIMQSCADYIIANYNHPSVVSWCVNNETFSVGLTSPENIRKINQPAMVAYDKLLNYLKDIDSSRIYEINHNYTLWAYVRMNKFSRKNFEVFNIHPYGEIGAVIAGEEKALGFKGEVPVLVGEVFAFDNALDFNDPDAVTFGEQRRVANSYASQIASAFKAPHVSGIILCGLSGSGRQGYLEGNDLMIGPWGHLVPRYDEDGKRIGIAFTSMKIHWPSLSGSGTKPEICTAWKQGGGDCAMSINWFDETVPVYTPSIIDKTVENAFETVNGGPLAPLPATRNPEIVGVADASTAGAFMWLDDPARPGRRDGVVIDPNGRGWFCVPDAGIYTLNAPGVSKSVEITQRPKLQLKAGYSQITWADMGGESIENIKTQLAQPAECIIRNIRYVNELVANRGFEFTTNGKINIWSNNPVPIEEAFDGDCAARLDGPTAQSTQYIPLAKGQKYHISGAIRKLAGKGHGSIYFSDYQYNVKFKLNGSDTIGEWTTVEGDYTAEGSEAYLYIRNDWMSDDGSVAYDNVSVQIIKEDPAELPLENGPFKLDENGFVRDFLRIGPFQNEPNGDGTYMAETTDYLEAVGGEAALNPSYRDEVEMELDERTTWLAGNYTLKWLQLHSTSGIIDFNNWMLLTEAGIVRTPSNMAGYLYCIIDSPEDQTVQFRLGSDDGYVLYVNGDTIGHFFDGRGCTPDSEIYSVPLHKGRNSVMLKVIQQLGGWSAALKITYPDGSPASNLTVYLE